MHLKSYQIDGRLLRTTERGGLTQAHCDGRLERDGNLFCGTCYSNLFRSKTPGTYFVAQRIGMLSKSPFVYQRPGLSPGAFALVCPADDLRVSP